MTKDLNLTLTPKAAAVAEDLKAECARALSIKRKDITCVRFLKKSYDCRRRDVKVLAQVRVFIGEEPGSAFPVTSFPDADPGKTAVVVGSGPAGLFAALTLLEHGWKPIVLERGKDVHERKKDTARLNREGVLDPESNYAFGEGGAGAFSDGKLYTRSVKRGDVGKVLSLFCQHGASTDILSDAHPHIGTEVLPRVIENMRNTIVSHGGEVRFNSKVVGLVTKNGEVTGARTADGNEFMGPVILATGHSARDVYRFLHDGGFAVEAKDVAVGVRLEHPQDLIDRMQYHSEEGRGLYLPAASYKFVTQVEGRGVYSFCMCPGGFVIPASTEPDALVVNGMSPSTRGSCWANSGIVVQLRTSDIPGSDPFAMIRYIESIERACWSPGFRAPAQRMDDFLKGKASSSLPASSYIPGLVEREMDEVLPALISSSLRSGIGKFVEMTRGKFLTHEALLIAPETRTSSPVRIPRGDDFAQVPGLYPCGEGAGYAGGIVSAALDGIASAEALMKRAGTP